MARSFGEGSMSRERGNASKNSARELVAEGSEFGFIIIGARTSSDLPSEDEGGRRVGTGEDGMSDRDSATNLGAETGERAGFARVSATTASNGGGIGIRRACK